MRRRRLPVGEPVRRAARRHRRLHDVRGRQHDPACSWSPRVCSPTTRTPSRTSTRSGWSGSWRRPRWRPCSSAPTPGRSSSGCATSCPEPWAAATTLPTRTCRTSSYHLEMLTWREEHILSSVARRLKRGMDSGRDPAEVFSLCQDHVISAAHAHVERIVLEAFLDKLETVDEGPNRDALKLLCDVYALTRHRAGPRLVPRARPALQRPRQGGHREGQRAQPPGPARSRSSSSTPSASRGRCCAPSCSSSQVPSRRGA